MEYRSFHLMLPMLLVSYSMQGADVAQYDIDTMQGTKLEHYLLAVAESDKASKDHNPTHKSIFLSAITDVSEAEDILLADLKPLIGDITTKTARVKALQNKTTQHITDVLSEKQLLAHTVGLLNWAKESFYADQEDKDTHAINFISQEIDRVWKADGVSFKMYAQQAEDWYNSFWWITRPSIPEELTQMLENTKAYEAAEAQYQDENNTKERMQELALCMREKHKLIESELTRSKKLLVSSLLGHLDIPQIGKDLQEIKETSAHLAELQTAAERILLHLIQQYIHSGTATHELIQQLTDCKPETAVLLAQNVNYYNNPTHYTVAETIAQETTAAIASPSTDAQDEAATTAVTVAPAQTETTAARLEKEEEKEEEKEQKASWAQVVKKGKRRNPNTVAETIAQETTAAIVSPSTDAQDEAATTAITVAPAQKETTETRLEKEEEAKTSWTQVVKKSKRRNPKVPSHK